MIEIVELSKLNNKTTYSVNSFIPRSENFSFSINENEITFYKNTLYFKHLKKLAIYSYYLIQLYRTYETIILEIQKRDKFESEIKIKYDGYEDWPDMRTIDDDEYGQLNFKEKLAAIRIRCGRCIHDEMKRLINFSVCEKSIQSLVKQTEYDLIKISTPDNEEADDKIYQKVYSAEDSIFYHYPEDCKLLLEKVISKYITSKEYFTNQGTSYFAIDTKTFLYLAGKTRGIIKGREYFDDFRNKYQKQVFDTLIDDFLQLKNDINSMIDSIEQNYSLLTDYSLSKRQKEQIFALRSNKAFNIICEQIDNAKKIFEFLIQKEYLCYNEQNILIKTDSFPNTCIYELLHDDNLPFHNYLRILHKQYSLLFGKEINDIRINKTSRGKWLAAKEVILNYLNSF